MDESKELNAVIDVIMLAGTILLKLFSFRLKTPIFLG